MNLNEHDAQRIDRALEGLLPPEELSALQADIVRDPQLRAAYVERLWLHNALRADREALPQLLATTDSAGEAPAAAWTHRSFWLRAAAWSGVAAGLAAAFVFGTRSASETPSTVATIVQAQNSRWAGSTLPTAEQSRVGPGTLSLVEGMVTLKFASGASVTLEAPTKLEILSAMRCRLIEGSVTADVPESAHGFTIDTPDLKVIDLGTRFGVTAGAAGDSHVYVFEGEVELEGARGVEPRRLTGGKSFHARSGAGSGSLEPRRFAPIEVVDGWTSIPTSFGRGKDTYVRRGHAAAFGAQPLLMVKHSDLPESHRNERRIFLTFDLGEPGNSRALTDAELLLDPQPSGLGFSAMVPDSRFAVYVVLDDARDDWNEHAVAWDNPPVVDVGASPDASLVKVGEFTIPRGGAAGPLTIRSPELATLLRSDTNGLVTLAIVRETGESHSSGLVHAFASKEHPSARPPTLRLR